MKNLAHIILSALAIAVISCKYEFPDEVPNQPKPRAGNADFKKYIAVGNSLTAGYMDGALYDRGQKNSYPAILAHQFDTVGGGDFIQPDISSESGFNTAVSPNPAGPYILGRLKLKSAGGSCSPAPSPIIPGQGITPYSGEKSLLNNFGVPGLTIGTALLAQTGGPASSGNPYYNPFYGRIASNPGTSTVIGDAASALANGGTFFSFWLGNNDVLGYATGGANNPALLTSVADFETRFKSALGTLLAVPNVKGVVANIPNVTDIPFFTTINTTLATPSRDACNSTAPASSSLPFNLSAAQAAGLNAQYSMAGINAKFKEGKVNYFLITTATEVRQMDPKKDYLVLNTPTDSLGSGELKNCDCTTKGARRGWGVTKPIDKKWVLDSVEVKEVKLRIQDFNTIIKNVAEDAANINRLAFVDINKVFGAIAIGGTSINGISFTAAIAPPFGGFSLDGVHPNARGSALIANEFIKAINAKFGSTVQLVNPNNYPGNDLP